MPPRYCLLMEQGGGGGGGGGVSGKNAIEVLSANRTKTNIGNCELDSIEVLEKCNFSNAAVFFIINSFLF